MLQKDQIEELISIYNRRLHILRRQKAIQGISVEPKIILEIEDIETEIEKLQEALTTVNNEVEAVSQLNKSIINSSPNETKSNELAKKLKSLELQNGELLVLKGKDGLAVIKIEHTDGCRANYKWRYKRETTEKEISGEAQLFEQYGHQRTSVITDLGGNLHMEIGPYKIEWSCGDSTSGWVYYYPKKVEAYIVSGIKFEDFRL